MKNLFGLSAAIVFCALSAGCGDKDDDTAAEDTAALEDTGETQEAGNDW